jgi:hypothetical protein
MPHYMARIELPRFQGREPAPRDYTRLNETMSSLLFDRTIAMRKLELPTGTYIGSSFDDCEALGHRVAEAVQTIWPNPRIVLTPTPGCWSYGLASAEARQALQSDRKQA